MGPWALGIRWALGRYRVAWLLGMDEPWAGMGPRYEWSLGIDGPPWFLGMYGPWTGMCPRHRWALKMVRHGPSGLMDPGGWANGIDGPS